MVLFINISGTDGSIPVTVQPSGFLLHPLGDNEFRVTVQPSNIPRGVTLHSQRDPEICERQTAKIAACVHAFVTVKPEG